MSNSAARQAEPQQAKAAVFNYEKFFACTDKDPLMYAFGDKVSGHPGLKSKIVPPEESAELFRTLQSQQRHGASAAYFNIPFCETRCTYCGFFNQFHNAEQSRQYTDMLIAELEASADTAAVTSWPIHAVYLGGGTPTALAPDDLLRLLQAIQRVLPLANDFEITLEGRISGLKDELIDAALKGGVNRFSVGVQSFDTALRRKTGRIDDCDTVVATLERLCAYDQAAVVIDLVFGFPEQTMEMWEEDLRILSSLPLDGADLYQLKLLPHTVLSQRILEGKSAPMATLPEQATMYNRAVEMMLQNLWQRISVCHWRRSNCRERSLYNRMVKKGVPILAYGCGAGGNLNGHGYFVTRDYAQYMEQMGQGEKPLGMIAYPQDNRILSHLISDGFDLGYLDLGQFERSTGLRLENLCAVVLEQWQQVGLLEIDGNVLRLTRAGEFWQATLAQALLEVCAHQADSSIAV
ncbi:MAG: heme anaerobic degradation radical SAM methyltransferase ChuW/HutW [Trichlorobacter sp.]|nr:heme anaerobic degradation radical SAM methyltransferase ChuW/HutW [Trichlorobacter sp.]